VARKGTAHKTEPLPPPLPPETRTVGQVVAETINLYRRRFWASLALGLGPALVGIGAATIITGWWALVFVLTVGGLLMTASYLRAVTIASETRPERDALLVAAAVGYVIFLPSPFIFSMFVLPAVA
jgi:hypothetical protein